MAESMQPIFADRDHPLARSDRPTVRARSRSSTAWRWVFAALAISILGLGAYIALRHLQPTPQTPFGADSPAALPPAVATEARPPQQPPMSTLPRFPVPAVDRGPLPALADSDRSLADALGLHLGAGEIAELLYSTDIAWRIVATIDALPQRQLARNLLPVRSPAGPFMASEASGRWIIDPRNQLRYAVYVALAEHVDSRRLVETYVKFYPLFEQEYRLLGHPDGNFNDRLVAVIDDLLAAPGVNEPVSVVRPKVLFEFQDSDLEDLSAGQKILVRIGPANAAILKRKLVEIRKEITTIGAVR